MIISISVCLNRQWPSIRGADEAKQASKLQHVYTVAMAWCKVQPLHAIGMHHFHSISPSQPRSIHNPSIHLPAKPDTCVERIRHVSYKNRNRSALKPIDRYIDTYMYVSSRQPRQITPPTRTGKRVSRSPFADIPFERPDDKIINQSGFV